jgi:PAS domain S-box-containing protein
MGSFPVLLRDHLDLPNIGHPGSALQDDDDLFRIVFERAAIGMAVFDSDERLARCNETFAQILGFTPQELSRAHFCGFGLPREGRFSAEPHEELLLGLRKSYRLDRRLARKDGRPVWCRLTVSLLWCGREDGAHVLCLLEDITEHKLAEEALLAAQTKLESLLSGGPAMIYTCRASGDCATTFLSPNASEQLGVPNHDLLGSPEAWLARVHPADVEAVRAAVAQARQRGRHELEYRFRHGDGTYRWIYDELKVSRDAEGNAREITGYRIDVTARKQAEEALLRQESLARMGEMAAVVAHEVRNPLACIAGAIQVIGRRLPAEADELGVVGEILARIDALNTLLENLLLFARPADPRIDLLDLHALLRVTASLLGKDPALQGVRVEIVGEGIFLPGDAELLKEVFLNILLNAAQAMGGEGKISVSTQRHGSWCKVEFEDGGPGIPAELRDKAFEPFFTTKHRGTGLGLAIAKRVVEAHQGQIAIESAPHGGARMIVNLPIF